MTPKPLVPRMHKEDTLFSEHSKKSVDVALELAKQMITLSTSVIVFTVTFGKEFLTLRDLGFWARILMGLTWFSFLLAIIGAILGIMTMTGSLAKENKYPPGIYAGHIRWPFFFAVVAFCCGIVFTVWLGFSILTGPPSTSNPQAPATVQPTPNGR